MSVESESIHTHSRIGVRLQGCMASLCMYACTYLCMYVCTYVCMYVCLCICILIYSTQSTYGLRCCSSRASVAEEAEYTTPDAQRHQLTLYCISRAPRGESVRILYGIFAEYLWISVGCAVGLQSNDCVVVFFLAGPVSRTFVRNVGFALTRARHVTCSFASVGCAVVCSLMTVSTFLF